jgi:superfamily II DNA or RNA helicase
MIPLRPYQQRCVDAVAAGWAQFRTQLVVAPTGAGKTILFSHIAHAGLPGRTLIIAHREELIDQAIIKLHRTTGIFAQKEKAGHSAGHGAEVVVASIQTLARRLDKWPSNHFRLIVIDEAHHASADSYRHVLARFPAARVLGVTATPDRADKKNLGAFFENVAFEIPLFELIHEGFLAPIKVKAIPLQIDIQDVRKTGGDYNPEDLGHAIHPYLRATAAAIADHAPFRKTLVFVPLVATSKDFVAECQAIGLNAAHIDGASPDRKEILARFAAGQIDILSNAMLLTEGYDEPSIDCVIVMRPTRSRALYSQMIGRGTRIHPGKRDLLVLDPLWLHERLDLVRPAHLIASNKEEALQITELAEAQAWTEQELDLEELQAQASRQREEALRRALEAKARREARTVDPVEFCLSLHDVAAAEYEPVTKWEAEPVSPAQAQFLRRMGLDVDSVKNKGHASRLITLLRARADLHLATPKQLKYLRRFGHPHPELCTAKEANAFLDQKWGRAPEQAVAA